MHAARSLGHPAPTASRPSPAAPWPDAGTGAAPQGILQPVHALKDGRLDHLQLQAQGVPGRGGALFEQACGLLLAGPARLERLALPVSLAELQAAPAGFERWLARLDTLGIEPDRLRLNVSDTTLTTHAERLVPALARLHWRTLRLERHLLRGIEHDAQVLARCEGLVEQAHRLGWQVMAADIDSAAQWAVLEAIGCDLGMARPDLFTVNSA